MELGKIIAINLKELRTERNLTLGQLSKISGISKAMLSDIEKGGSNPTINTIWKIANGLNVPYTKLMEGIEKEATIIRKSETVAQNGETEHYRVYCYFRNTPVRNFELFYVELDANSSNASIGHSEKAQEYLYIIQGELVLHTETGDYTLNEETPLRLIPPSDIPTSMKIIRCLRLSVSIITPTNDLFARKKTAALNEKQQDVRYIMYFIGTGKNSGTGAGGVF